MLYSHEVVVPRSVVRNLERENQPKPLCHLTDDKRKIWKVLELNTYHIEPKETVTKKHLDLLIMSWQITMWVATIVLVATSPLVATWCQLICCQ
jgi:hypothetical protein